MERMTFLGPTQAGLLYQGDYWTWTLGQRQEYQRRRKREMEGLVTMELYWVS